MENKRHLGSLGEDVALNHLLSKSYRLLNQNYRYRKGEIDLIMLSPQGVLVFIEVKSCFTPQTGLPEWRITPKKIIRIQRTAQAYCAEHTIAEKEMRFDVIAVEINGKSQKIRHFENAFLPDSRNYH